MFNGVARTSTVPNNAAQSFRPAYSLDGGFNEISLNSMVSYSLNNKWSILGIFDATTLVGDTADSPLVESAFQPSTIIGLTARF